MKTTKNLMYQITKQASLFLLIFACLSFVGLIIFKVEYWLLALQPKFNHTLAWVMGVTIAIVVEGVRFSLMVASAEDIAKGRTLNFLLGMLGSIALLVYEVFYMANVVGASWSTTDDTYTNLFKFLALVGMLLELRLCLLMSGTKESKEKIEADEDTSLNENHGKFKNLFNDKMNIKYKNG